MKKYGLASIIIILICVICVFFQVPSRIAFFIEKHGYYNSNDYEQTVLELPTSCFKIVLSSWNNVPEVVYRYSDRVYVQLDSVTKESNHYLLQFTSYADCSFDKGVLIEMVGVPPEEQLSMDINFWLRGESSVTVGKHYTFEISPSEFCEVSFDDMEDMSIEIPIHVCLKTYERV